jgi:glycosyltransferase involved in cell wall biosynthesis
MRDSLLPRAQAREELGLGDHFWFVNVARLVPDKDQATLIRGFAEVARTLPQVRLAILGAGRLEADLKALVITEQITDKVMFLGNIQRCYRYLPAFDSFVLTSAREAFGMVLLEAMLAGLPVIASDLKGVSEVVGKLAWRFKAGDPGLLAKQLSMIYHLGPDERKDCELRMLQHVTEYYSTESMRRTFWALPFLRDWGL